MQAKKKIPWVILALLFMSAHARWIQIRENHQAIDFYGYWEGARMISANKDMNIYSLEEIFIASSLHTPDQYRSDEISHRDVAMRAMRVYEGRLIDSGHTPFLFAVGRIFSVLDFQTAYRISEVLSLGLFILSLCVMARQMTFPTEHSLLWITLILISFEPLHSDIAVGNINQLQLALLILSTSLASSPLPWRVFVGGVGLGFAAALKPNVAPALVTLCAGLLVGRFPRHAPILVGGIASALVVAVAAAGFWYNGLQSWVNWMEFLPRLLSGHYNSEIGNYGLIQLGRELLHVPLQGALVISGCLMYLLILLRLQPKQPTKGDKAPADAAFCFFHLGYGLIFVLFTSGLVWIHYYLFILPLLFFGGRPGYKAPPHGLWPLLMFIGLIPFSPLAFSFIAYSPKNEMILSVSGALYVSACSVARLCMDRRAGSRG